MTLSIAHEDWFWQPFCDVLDKPALRDLGGRQRAAGKDALRQEIAAALVKRPLAEWGGLFDAAGVPWGPVNSLAETLEDPHVRARGLIKTLIGAGGAEEIHLVQPLKFLGYEVTLDRPAPALGADTDEVLGQRGG